MSAEEIDEYLAGIDEPQRSTLEAMRNSILHIVPEAEQGIAYGSPAFKLGGKAVAGFAAFHKHVSYLPHSGSVVDQIGDELAGYKTSKGAVQFAIDQPLPDALIRLLIEVRMKELGLG